MGLIHHNLPEEGTSLVKTTNFIFVIVFPRHQGIRITWPCETKITKMISKMYSVEFKVISSMGKGGRSMK